MVMVESLLHQYSSITNTTSHKKLSRDANSLQLQLFLSYSLTRKGKKRHFIHVCNRPSME